MLTINQIHNEGKHAQTFELGNALDASVGHESPDTSVVHEAPDASVVHETGDPTAANTTAAAAAQAVTVNDTVQGPQTADTDNVEVSRRDGHPPLPPSLAGESLAPLHEHDESRSKKLAYLLNSFYRLPGHPNTLLAGDSHLTNLDGKEVDPDDDQVRVRSAGGLCIPATVHALARHTRIYKKFKSVIYVLGTNDSLHSEQHCEDDRPKYLKLLYSETARIFPKAKINFVLPFIGLKGVSNTFIDALERDIKLACPDMAVFRPPSMARNKISIKGIHLNKSGRLSFIKYLRATFVVRKQRVFSSDSGRSRSNTTPHDPQGANTGFRVPGPHIISAPYPGHLTGPHANSASNPWQLTGPPASSASYPGHLTGPQANSVPHPGVPPQGVSQPCDQGLVNDIASKVMELFSQQNMLCRYYPPLPAWPPNR